MVCTMVRTGSKAQGFKEVPCVVLWFKMSGLAELIHPELMKKFCNLILLRLGQKAERNPDVP